MDFTIKRTNITNWHKKVGEYYFEPLVQQMKEELLKEEVLHADETTFNVLESSRTKDYVWLFSSGRYANKRIHIYQHGPSRESKVPEAFLEGFTGYLHSDGYSSYNKLTKVTPVGCFAHVRRKFFEALPTNEGKKKSTSREAVEKCNALFKAEKKLADLTVEERHAERKKLVRPLEAADKVTTLIFILDLTLKNTSKRDDNSRFGWNIASFLGLYYFENVKNDFISSLGPCWKIFLAGSEP